MRAKAAVRAAATIGWIATAISCGGDPTGPDPALEAVGLYVLETVDGRPPPVDLFTVGPDEEGAFTIVALVSGSYDLRADRRIEAELVFRETRVSLFDGGSQETFPPPVRTTGTWTLTGPSLVLRYADGNSDTATLLDGRFTIAGHGSTLVFRRVLR